jgi:hypothetical protein
MVKSFIVGFNKRKTLQPTTAVPFKGMSRAVWVVPSLEVLPQKQRQLSATFVTSLQDDTKDSSLL